MNQIVLPAIYVLIIGLFVFLITIVLCGQVNKIFQKRYNNIIVGVLGLAIFIAGKYVWYIIDFINKPEPLSFAGYNINEIFWNNHFLANLALVSFPDLMLLIFSVVLILDKTKAFAKVVAPYGLFFGLLFLLASTFNYSTNSFVTDWNWPWYKFIFIGDGITRMPSITYIYLIFVSLISIISNREYTRWSIFSSILFGLTMIIYSRVFQISTDVGANGLTAIGYFGLSQDLSPTNGTYYANYFFAFGQSLGINGDADKAWIGITVIYGLMVVIVTLVFVLKNLLTTDVRRINFIYFPWYHFSKILRNPCATIDAHINNFLYKFCRNSYLFGINPKDLPVIQRFLRLLQSSSYTGDINIDNLKEYVEALRIKKVSIQQKKQQTKKTADDKKKQTSNTSTISTTNNKKKKKNEIVKPDKQKLEQNKWTDENGVIWSLDNNGKYYYFSANEWIAY